MGLTTFCRTFFTFGLNVRNISQHIVNTTYYNVVMDQNNVMKGVFELV